MNSKQESTELSFRIKNMIQDFIKQSPENTLQNETQDKAFDSPLVGFSRGDDPLYEAYKDHVGPFYMTPQELFTVTFRDFNIKPEELTVISWILPQAKVTKSDNRKETFYPSERWARARIFGEEVNEKLRKHTVMKLESEGIQIVAPALTPQFSMRISPKYGFASTWSERHAAYAAGLGTFGLCDGLITPVGKAIRVGSVVARLEVPAAPRPYQDHQAYCLFFSHGTCLKCVERCPVKAISSEGHDKIRCRQHLEKVRNYLRKKDGLENKVGCGLCQVGVPCESHIPSPDEG